MTASRKEVGFLVSKHMYVPKHELLSEKKAKEVLEQYNTRPELLPYILASDPMCRELGAKPGNVVMITRKSLTAGETYYYRYVLEG